MSLAYSTYRSSGSSALAPGLQLDIDTDVTDANTKWQGRLVYEPYYTHTVSTGVWQTWNPLDNAGTGNWWFTSAPGNAVCTLNNPCTWSELKAAFPNAGIRSAGPNTGALQFKAGGGWASGFVGSVDAFSIGINNVVTTYDFERTINIKKAYFPSILKMGASDYRMWYQSNSRPSNTTVAYATSVDGLSWTPVTSAVSGLVAENAGHPHVEFADGKYRIWYWNATTPYGNTAMHYAESVDGIIWINDSEITGNLTNGGVADGWNKGTYGAVDVIVNDSPTNSGTNPFDYKYAMYYDATSGGYEQIALGYSTDGIAWTLYGTGPVLPKGISGSWDSGYTAFGTIIKDDFWRMWYSGGISASNEGIGCATSIDGLVWAKCPSNPLMSKNDGVAWRNNRTYTPSLIKDGSDYKMWFTGKDTATGNYTVGYATLTSSETGHLYLPETSNGGVSLPSGASNITLNNDSVLNVASNANVVSGGTVIVAGATITLSSFTSGDLTSVDLSALQKIGGQSVTIGKAVQISSGVNGIPIILTNLSLGNTSVSIPDDTTILAPSGWNGIILPPRIGLSLGDTPPAGFSIGSPVIEIGSTSSVLLFDKPVQITLNGVAGSVGYKPAGLTTWTKISAICGGTYGAPTLSALSFPGECSITNGTDTKILTYHFATFGGLNPIVETLTYTAGTNGSIVGATPQTVNYNTSGTLVTATPDAGYHFVSWSDGVLTAARTDSNVVANIFVTASFAINTYTLTYTAGLHGSINGTSSQTVNYGTDGTLVAATADAGYHFVSWSDGVLTATRTDSSVIANISATASFAVNTFTLTYTAGTNGSIVGATPQTVNYNTSGTLVTATPDAGYHFVSWSDGILTAARTDTNVVANISVTASFAVNIPVLDHFVIDTISTQTAGNAFNVTITAKDNGGNTITGFVGTVDLTSNSGSINPTTSGSFISGVRLESVTLTGSGTGRTIIATRTGGSETGTSNTFTVGSAATKFVIVNPADNTVGNNVDVTIQAQDSSNTLASDYTGDVTLALSGDATFVSGTGLVHLVNGIATKTITDHTAETVNLTLSDTELTHLDVSSTQDVIFSAGSLHHFTIDNISSPQTAGSNISTTITAKDSFGNTVNSFTGTVDFSTTAGTITPTVSNNFVSGILTQNITVIQSGAGKTISVINTTGSETGISNSFTVNPGSTAKFILNDPGDMVTGTRAGYTVTRKDQNDNLVTSGSDTVYLYTTSGPTSKFYDAATAGNQIISISIDAGQSSASFWSYDDNVGSWTIKASDNASVADGSAGINDGTDNINVNITAITPTQFIVDAVSSNTVGDTVSVSVKAVDGSNNLDTTYNRTDSSLILNSTGNSTANSGLAVNINNGIGTINISDNKAETITLSLADNNPDVPPLALTTKDITFAPGVFDHFILDNISSPQTAGQPFNVAMTAQDSFGNTASSFNGTVNFSTTAGSITPAISNSFVSGILTQSVSVTQSGTSKTITVTKTGDVQNSTSNVFDVNPGSISSFLVEASGGGDITAQTLSVPFDIKITAEDSFGNIASDFNGTASISSTGTLSAGNTTASFVAGILATHSVTISNTGNFTITTTSGSAVGISNSFNVSSVPIVATKFKILKPLDVQVGQSTTVTIKAVDNSDNVDNTFQGHINLAASGSATGAGSVDIVNGVGSKIITDAVAETVNLTLTDVVPPTTLDFSSTQNVVFSAAPPVISSGGGGSNVFAPAALPVISFSGQAFPSGNLTVFAISNGAIPIKQDLIKSADGKFNLNFNSELSGSTQYGIFVTDKNGHISQAKIYTLQNGVPNLSVAGLVMSPTVDFLRTSLFKGDFLSVSGYASPGSTVLFEVDGKAIDQKATASADGSYNLLWNTVSLDLGQHSLRVKQITTDGLSSEFSPTKNFNLTNYIITPTDFNSDGKINLSDVSIFLSLWYNLDNPDRSKLDLNHDGKIDIQDLSAFLRTLQK